MTLLLHCKLVCFILEKSPCRPLNAVPEIVYGPCIFQFSPFCLWFTISTKDFVRKMHIDDCLVLQSFMLL